MTKTPDIDNRPNQDTYTPARPSPSPSPSPKGPASREPRGIDHSIADADKVARTGGKDESARNTPPFGDDDDSVPHDSEHPRGKS